MRVVLTFIVMLGLFFAGILFAIQPAVAFMLLGVCMVSAGLLYAVAETHGFEGQYVASKGGPYRWEALFLDVVRLAIDRGKVAGKEAVYVQTNDGVQEIHGIFGARINGEMGIVFDTSTLFDRSHEWNGIKQGVM